MPLDTNHEMVWSIELDCFNYPIFRTHGRYPEVIPGGPERLVVAGIHLNSSLLRCNRIQARTLSDTDRMRLSNFSPRLMVHRVLSIQFQILDQRPIPPNIQGLGAITNGENRLTQIESILQQQFVHRRTVWIGIMAGSDPRLAVGLRIEIESASRQQHALDPGEQAGDAILPLM